ncbi:uncharacterized protein A4U43_C09F10990 [Asparagus officinalis]|uniref:Protein FAR1-RELATED SEQUENCE n=1 Tax=Asparagus officinalis TaxID=4686 RepID=A0A5P1E6Y9_ASPOF|nr:uncharacterized protein A4U43_C09F10990 [Asparagus officinalis]
MSFDEEGFFMFDVCIMEEPVKENNDSLERSKEDLKPKFFMEFDYEIDAYDFYNEYARSEGFSIRRAAYAADFYNEYARSEGFSIRRAAYAADKQGVLTSRTKALALEELLMLQINKVYSLQEHLYVVRKVCGRRIRETI